MFFVSFAQNRLFMKKAVLVCDGSIDTKFLYSNIGKNDFLVAVDGGANKLSKTTFVPDLIIGDMDSISRGATKKFRKSEFIRYPMEKDQTDLELALEYCAGKNFGEIVVLGAFGSRADMNLANVFCLCRLPKKVKAKIVHENQEIFLLKNKTVLFGVPGEKISFLALNGNVRGLSLEGFLYGLSNSELNALLVLL